MATTLVSPGVAVDVIDQSFYATNGPGTVPFILLATRESKTNPSGNIASGTLPENAGQVYTVSSSRELQDTFGVPVFPKNASGNAIYGSETAEYGLLAANSVLDVSARAYVVRADIDLGQLTSTSIRPTGPVANGTSWLDTSNSSWGIFEWNAVTNTFSKVNPRVITSTADETDGVPNQSLGAIGDYAVVTTLASNPVYYKNQNNNWVLVGSTGTIFPLSGSNPNTDGWQLSYPAISGTVYNPTFTSGDKITINTVDITISGTNVAALASAINAATIPGIYASGASGFIEIYATSDAMSDGSTADGVCHLTNNTTHSPHTIVSSAGLTEGYFACPTVQLSAHTQVPAWKSFDSTPRPSGSVWIKTTAVAGGANLNLYRWSTNANSWVLQSAPLYPDDVTALRFLDPSRGGLGVAASAVYVQYDYSNSNTVTYQLLSRAAIGTMTVTGTAANPTFTAGNMFRIAASVPGSTTMTFTTITLSTTTAIGLVTDLLSAGIDYIDATVSASGNVQITHTAGGVIYLANVSGEGTPLATAGFTSATTYIRDSGQGYLIASNWVPLTYSANSVSPVAIPADGTLWYYGTPIVADIMISDGTYWRGYQNLTGVDVRGFDLTQTDPNGPIISASKPTTQSDGITSLALGDLWIDTSDLENYPMIYRWESVNTENQWVAIDTSDDTSENGIVFADARWDTAGTSNPVTDAYPAISDLLMSDYVDLDAPSPTVYPRGVLLFNTRRSSYNVKEYVYNHFNNQTFAGESLPVVRDAWVSISGARSNNVPYFGRRAVRSVVVSAMKAAIDNSEQLREDARFFNIMATPGYPELIPNMVALNTARRETAFIIGDLPMGLSSDSTTLENYIINSTGETSDNEYGLFNSNTFVGVYYPSAALTNDTTGATVAVPASHMVLKVFINNDTKAYPWFAPAGETRGTIDNATNIGYVNRATGQFVAVGTRQGVRDLLYSNRVNPIVLFNTSGLVVYGQKTRAGVSSALDRINVARLVNYIRYQLEKITKPLIFEPNDKITRNEAKGIVSSMLNDILSKRGLYDYLVVCDESNNTPATIDRNELHIDVAIEPAKAVEFVYIPVRILNTGGIKAGNLVSQPVG
jgi:Phage tail sheath C-terminal domain